MAKPFALRCTIHGHEADVRAVSAAPNCGLLSASRDKTAKYFSEDVTDQSFFNQQTYIGHTNFVYCVKFVENIFGSNESVILTGSSDNLIRCFMVDETNAILEIPGHTNAVSCLSIDSNGSFVSGSWDFTAKSWKLFKNDDKILQFKLTHTMTGHTHSIWDLFQTKDNKYVVTASADKNIKIWENGKCFRTLEGHTDCVRGLALLPNSQFLSCSNDATIKLWTFEGKCLHTFYGHENFIYSVSALGANSFVSSGEDRTVRVWELNNTNPIQTLPIPAQSAWQVAVLTNGDVAVGASDSTIRIFTREASRKANEAEAAKYEEELSSSQIAKDGNNMSDIDTSKLPGKEGLEIPGKKDGENKLILNGSTVEVYSWSVADSKWTKIGDAVGSNSNGKKSMYNGKEYDYVFDINIQEGMPDLKLPYNLNEDPWFAAQKFIDDNDLPQDFLDQIATHITDNTKQRQISSEATSGGSDPFTGGGRYIPGGTPEPMDTGGDPFTSGSRYIPGSSSNGDTQFNGQDPFTGQGRYIPGNESSDIVLGGGAVADPMINPSRYIPDGDGMEKKPIADKNIYFPKRGYLKFESSSPKIMEKITEFSLQNQDLALTANQIIDLEDLTNPQKPITDSHLECLWKILKWPENFVMPALDLFRLACVKNDAVCSEICVKSINRDGPDQLLDLLTGYIRAEGTLKYVSNNRLMSLRILCNMFASPEGAAFVCAGYKRIFNAINGANKNNATPFNSSKLVQSAVATTFVNFAVLINATQSNPSAKVKALNSNIHQTMLETLIAHLITFGQTLEKEAMFRYLVALGTALSYPGAVLKAISLEAIGMLNLIESDASNPPKVQNCLSHLKQSLSSI